MSEKKQVEPFGIELGKLLRRKREALGSRYMSREKFIEHRSDELFGSEDWISLRHLFNIEHGKNIISIEKLILLSDALEEDPVDLFSEIVDIYRKCQIPHKKN